MIKDIKKLFLITGILFLGLVVWSCEAPSDELGSQFFQNGTAKGEEALYDVVAYNIFNGDSIRVDRNKYGSTMSGTYDSITLGAFNEPVFGKQKVSYFTQLRLSSYGFDFGTTPTVDSVVLSIKPRYATDSVTTNTNSSYVYPDGNVDSKKVVNTYPIKKYGKRKIGGNSTSFKIQVYEVTDFMGSYGDKFVSNQNYNAGTLLGSKTFDGTINSVTITKNSDNTSLWSTDDVGVRIPLDAAFFQSKITAKSGKPELADVATFIRYFKGLKIAVAEDDGYLFRFNASDISLKMYYKNDTTTNGVTTRTQSTFSFDLAPSYNAHFNQIQYDRTGTPIASIPSTPNSLTGDSKLYLQGMGGPGVGIKIPAATVQTLKNLYSQEKAGIIQARIRLYVDNTSWNNKFEKPNRLIVRQNNLYTYLTDLWSFGRAGYVYYNSNVYNLTSSPTYYDISITDTLKKIIEKNEDNKDLIINSGEFEILSTGALIGFYTDGSGNQASYSYNFNTRSYTKERVVLVGTDSANANRAQLIVDYAKK